MWCALATRHASYRYYITMSGQAIQTPIVSSQAADVGGEQETSFVQRVKGHAKEFAGRATGKEHEVS